MKIEVVKARIASPNKRYIQHKCSACICQKYMHFEVKVMYGDSIYVYIYVCVICKYYVYIYYIYIISMHAHVFSGSGVVL